MRILTFNLRTSYARGDGADHWERRKEIAAQTILDIDPDICGLQEMDPGMWADLEPPLNPWRVIKGMAQSGSHENGNGLLIRKSAYQVEASGQFWLSDTPDFESITFKHDWGPRIVLWARISGKPSPKGRGEGEGRLREAGRSNPFIIAVTHFDTNPESWLPASRVCLRELGKIAGEPPLFLMGDFNSPAGSPAWKTLERSGFRDAWTELKKPEGAGIFTFHSFRGEDKNADGRIDWILHRGPWKAESSAIDKRNREGAYPSDHFPVYADYR